MAQSNMNQSSDQFHISSELQSYKQENNGTYFLTDSNKSDDKKNENVGFEGAFVYPTKAGYYRAGICSFDFNSLYPNVMMTVNISPDTKVGKVISNEEDTNVTIRKTNGQIVNLTKGQFAELLDKKCTISANNVLYVKPSLKMGIIRKLFGFYV